MSKAFDSADHQILLHKMQNVCTLTSALKILDGLTATSQNNVYQVVWSHSSLSDPLPAECGVPQRSILSRRPIILHKLCVNDLEEVPLEKEWVLLYRMLCRQYKIVCFFPLTQLPTDCPRNKWRSPAGTQLVLQKSAITESRLVTQN